MAKLGDLFPSRFLSAADLQGKDAIATIERVEVEKFDDDAQKPIVYFQGKAKGLVCNKTNFKSIALIAGDDTDNWSGNDIILFPVMVDFKGRREADLAREGRELFDALVRETIFPEAEHLIAEHHAKGHTIAIVSGATRYVVEPLAEYLGVTHMLYTRLEAEDGLLTGRVLEPLCFDEGKIYWVQQFVEDETVDLARSYFYTDSVTDLPLLELVGHPVVTNPDPILYRAAIRRRWPVRFFEAPDSADPGPPASAGPR